MSEYVDRALLEDAVARLIYDGVVGQCAPRLRPQALSDLEPRGIAREIVDLLVQIRDGKR
jgi:hypothetical protein